MSSSVEGKHPGESPHSARSSGRMAFDDAGRGVWEWQVQTGIFQKVITEEQLSKISATTLALHDVMKADGTTHDMSWQLRTGSQPATKSKAIGFLGRWRKLLR